jgi:hypothetical protein
MEYNSQRGSTSQLFILKKLNGSRNFFDHIGPMKAKKETLNEETNRHAT